LCQRILARISSSSACTCSGLSRPRKKVKARRPASVWSFSRSHRGLSGRNGAPRQKITAGINCTMILNRHCRSTPLPVFQKLNPYPTQKAIQILLKYQLHINFLGLYRIIPSNLSKFTIKNGFL
jgi:hypothetical protein